MCSGMRCQKNNFRWLRDGKPRQSVFDDRKYDLSCPPAGGLGKRGLKDQALGRFRGGLLSHRSNDMAALNVDWSQRSTGKFLVDFGFSILIARPRRHWRVDCFLNFAEVVIDTQIK